MSRIEGKRGSDVPRNSRKVCTSWGVWTTRWIQERKAEENSCQRSASSNETMENRFIQSIIPKSHLLSYLYRLVTWCLCSNLIQSLTSKIRWEPTTWIQRWWHEFKQIPPCTIWWYKLYHKLIVWEHKWQRARINEMIIVVKPTGKIIPHTTSD